MQMVVPARFGQQPQCVAPINRANPLTQGMVLALLPAQGQAPIDLIGNLAFAAQGGTVVKTTAAGGIGWDVSTAATDGMQAASSIASGYPITFGVVFVPGTLGTNVQLFGVSNSGAANTSSRLGLRIGTSSVDAYSANSSGTTAASSTGAPTVGRINTAVGVFASNASRKAYLNGVAAAVQTTSIVVAGLSNTCIGSASGTTRQSGQVGQYMLAVVWNRALSDNEAMSFTRDPWQIFRSGSRKILLPQFLAVTLSATQASSAAVQKQALATRSATQASAASAPQKIVAATRSAAQVSSASLQRVTAVIRSASTTGSAVLSKTAALTRSASTATAAVLARTVGVVRSAATATGATVSKAISVFRGASAGSAVTLGKGVQTTRSAATTAGASLQRSIATVRAAATTTSAAVRRGVTLTRAASIATAAVLRRGISITRSAVSALIAALTAQKRAEFIAGNTEVWHVEPRSTHCQVETRTTHAVIDPRATHTRVDPR